MSNYLLASGDVISSSVKIITLQKEACDYIDALECLQR